MATPLAKMGIEWDSESLSGALTVPLCTFVPEPYELLKAIPIVIQPSEDGYIATFFDAGISMSGDTQREAFESLRALILDIFESLSAEPPERLGPVPARQLAVLRTFLRGA